MAKKTATNPNDFILPDLGEGVHEAELLKWRVEVGQTVAEHDILADMETDKAVVEVPSPRPGTIAKLWGEAGEIMHVGEPLVSYEPADGAAPAPAPEPAAAAPAATNGTHTEEREDDGTVVGQMSGELAAVSRSGKALATPAVRRVARDLGIDIDTVVGTGIGGRVTEKDLHAAQRGAPAPAPVIPSAPTAPVAPPPAPSIPSSPAISAPAPAPATPSVIPIPEGEAAVRIPFRGVRRTIANKLRESVNQAVHFNVMDEADVTALDGLRKKLGAASGEKVSFLPFVASAVCRVLSNDRFRSINATVDDANEEIVQHRAVHMGIATDTDAGLMVPVIRDCDAFGVLEIGRQITNIAANARNRSIPREQLVGSTFTISNVGSHAGRFATPIINYPEVGIIAVGRAREGMVVKDGWYRVGKLLPLSLACDHRVVDGATAALALAEIIRLLQDPDQLLTPARG